VRARREQGARARAPRVHGLERAQHEPPVVAARRAAIAVVLRAQQAEVRAYGARAARRAAERRRDRALERRAARDEREPKELLTLGARARPTGGRREARRREQTASVDPLSRS
jgi:hypothetical protein